MSDATTVTDVPDQHRYEIRLDGELAGFAIYHRRGGRAYFVTATDSGKAKRLTRNERVELASTTASDQSAPILSGRAVAVAHPPMPGRGVLRPTGPLFWSWLLYRLGCHRMRLYRIDLG